jgi:hypothetical protein
MFILSKFTGSKDCLLPDDCFNEDFCTLNATFVGEGASGGIGGPPARSNEELLDFPGPGAPLCAAALCACVLLPQWHVCFLGIAAVTLPQPHACCGGCGQTLSGLPGFLTGTISLSFAWVHFVDRWPRIQGSLDRGISRHSGQIPFKQIRRGHDVKR